MASVRATLDLVASPGFLATEDKQQQAGHASVVRFLFLGAACISTFPNGGARGEPSTACSLCGTSHTVSRRRTVSLPLSPPNAPASDLCLDQGSEKATEQLPLRPHGPWNPGMSRGHALPPLTMNIPRFQVSKHIERPGATFDLTHIHLTMYPPFI